MFSEAIQKYSLCRAAWSQTDPNGIEKYIHCSKLMPLQSFHCLGWNILLTGVVYLMIDTYN